MSCVSSEGTLATSSIIDGIIVNVFKREYKNKMTVKEEEKKEETENKNGEEVIDERLPIDRGWAWVVMIACLMNTILVSGYGKSLGLLFVEFVDFFRAPTTLLTLNFGVLEASMSLSCFITMNIILEKTTVRKVVIVGVIMSSIGILLSSFSQGIPFFICTQIIVGIGRVIIDPPGLVLIGRYFRRRRALATAVVKTGVSLGAVTFPYLVRYLLETYSLMGTLMVMSGLQFQTLVFAMFLVEPEAFVSKNKKSAQMAVVNEEEIELQGKKNGCIEFQDDNGQYDHKNSGGDIQHRLNRDTDSNNSLVDHLSRSRLVKYISNPDLLSVSKSDIRELADTEAVLHTTRNKNCLRKFAALFDFSLLRNYKFLLLTVSSVFAMAAYPGIVYLPALLIENGANETNAALFLTVAGLTDVCARLLFGYIGDLGVFKRYHLVSFALFICGLNFMFTRYYRSFELQIMVAIIYGASFGPYACLQPVILIDYLGLKNLAKAIGFTYLIDGVAISCNHVIVGAIRDASGSYTLCFTYMGCSTLLACGLQLLLPFAEKLENNKTRRPQKDDGEEECLNHGS